jgi:lysophospholipase L1-like esterase
MRNRTRPLVAMVVAGFFGLAASEVILRIREARAQGDLREARRDELVNDPGLGIRLAPFANGSDANGFRNDRVPRSSPIVALGDSQTWGINAPRSKSWPAQLSSALGENVYNLSSGGWGTTHYFAALPDALQLAPRLVIVGLYLGNDLYDAYRLAYANAEYAGLRLDPEGLSADTVGPKAWEAWHVEKRFHARFGSADPRFWGLWLRAHTAVGRAVERFWPGGCADAWHEVGVAWAREYPEYGIAFDNGRVRTVLTTKYRLLAVDLSEPRIREGLRLTNILLPMIGTEVERHGAKLLVLLIPTKEAAFADLLATRHQAPRREYAELTRQEGRCRASVLETCATARIECLDLLPPLKAALGEGLQIYATTTESHPNPLGYSVVSAAIEARLRHLRWVPPLPAPRRTRQDERFPTAPSVAAPVDGN